MDNQNQNPVTPPATQNDLPVSEIVSALKSVPPAPRSETQIPSIPEGQPAPVTPVAPIVNPLQEVAAPPVSPVVTPAAPIAPTPPAPSAVNPLAEDPDQVIAPGSK